MDKLYVVSNFGEYATNCEDGRCGWSFDVIGGKTFKSYQKAYNFMRKINKAYGYDRCNVERLNRDCYRPYWWDVMIRKAI